MKLTTLGFAAAVAALSLSAGGLAWQNILTNTAVEPVRKGTAIAIDSRMNFRFDRAWVWSCLVKARGIEALTGFDVDTEDEDKDLSEAGEKLAAKWGDVEGVLVVTAIDRGRELRLLFESEDDSVHIRRFRLATAGEGAVLHHRIQYTDFGDSTDAQSQKVHAEVETKAIAFRKFAQPPPPPPRSE